MRYIKQFILERFQLKTVFTFLYTSVYNDYCIVRILFVELNESGGFSPTCRNGSMDS